MLSSFIDAGASGDRHLCPAPAGDGLLACGGWV